MRSLRFSRLCHELIAWDGARSARQFISAFSDVRKTQEKIFNHLLQLSRGTPSAGGLGLNQIQTYLEFREKIAVTGYETFSPGIEKQKSGEKSVLSLSPCSKYQPTSGSTSTMKWIPYTEALLAEFNRAAGAWISDMGKNYPAIKNGKHYWSLSWLPDELRAEVSSNDAELFPLWKRVLMQNTMAVPDGISRVKTSHAAMIASLAYLCAEEDLSFISIWSPTYGLSLLNSIQENRDLLVEILTRGTWGEYQSQIGNLRCPKNPAQAKKVKTSASHLTSALWPKLALISAWDTANSALFAKDLKRAFPHADFQGKGLWATEGVVTIPFQGKYPLALTSHFYEFKNLATGTIHPAWELQKNWVVQPLLSTGSGFWRYALSDRLEVVDFIESCPCFKFLGRLEGVDLVGEKMSTEISAQVLESISQQNSMHCFALAGVESAKPFYLLLIQAEIHSGTEEKVKLLAVEGELELCRSFHYKLARELGQLAPCRAKIISSAPDFYAKLAQHRGQVEGNLKAETLAKFSERDWNWIKTL